LSKSFCHINEQVTENENKIFCKSWELVGIRAVDSFGSWRTNKCLLLAIAIKHRFYDKLFIRH